MSGRADFYLRARARARREAVIRDRISILPVYRLWIASARPRVPPSPRNVESAKLRITGSRLVDRAAVDDKGQSASRQSRQLNCAFTACVLTRSRGGAIRKCVPRKEERRGKREREKTGIWILFCRSRAIAIMNFPRTTWSKVTHATSLVAKPAELITRRSALGPSRANYVIPNAIKDNDSH